MTLHLFNRPINKCAITHLTHRLTHLNAEAGNTLVVTRGGKEEDEKEVTKKVSSSRTTGNRFLLFHVAVISPLSLPVSVFCCTNVCHVRQ